LCPNELLDAPMPPLMLISLAENAVKHGIEPKVGPGCITVRIGCQSRNGGAMLMASVDDDGVGFGGKNAGSGIGLVNIRERLKAMYGNEASLLLTEREDGGVRASLQIPLAAQ
jgi:sensor histidine kinase YesM